MFFYRNAPQFITFKEGKLGVNFGGYHAAVGLGGLLGKDGGAGGGLFAEAGTPHGQAARAGLGGQVDGKSGTSGGLYAGATAGGNVKAEAGLGGEVGADRRAGGGFASASSGHHYASSGLGGVSVNKETNVALKPVESNSEAKFEAANEIVPLTKGEGEAKVEVKAEVPPAVLVKEVSNRRVPRHHRSYYSPVKYQRMMSSWFNVPQLNYEPSWLIPRFDYINKVYVEPQPQVIEKTFYHVRKPHRHHLRKTAYIGGYIGADAEAPVAQPEVFKVQPIERRADVGVEANAHAAAEGDVNVKGHHDGSGEVTYTKKVTIQKTPNPTFFQDIFNIPIATLKAVNSFLTNTAGSTSVSVQKTASVNAESDIVPSKHEPVSKSVSSDAHISVQTPSANQFIDDIFSIPINTLSAVNTFLENNVARRQAQRTAEISNEPTKVRLGPHARRRANKQVIIVQEPAKPKPESEASA